MLLEAFMLHSNILAVDIRQYMAEPLYDDPWMQRQFGW